MKPRMIIVLLVIILALGIFYWIGLPVVPSLVPEKTATTSKPIAPPPGHLASSPIGSPPLAPAAQPLAPASGSQASASSLPADPQSDLKTAIPDIVAMMREGDLAKFYETYCPPEKFSLGMLQVAQRNQENQAAETDPQMLQIIREIRDLSAKSYEALEEQTPALNVAGDEATFQYTPYGTPGFPPPEPRPLVFIKINGKWYFNGRF